MEQQNNTQNSTVVLDNLLRYILKDHLLFFSILALTLTSIVLKKLPVYSIQDVKFIYILFVLFIIVKGLETHKFYSKISLFVGKNKYTTIKLILLTIVLSMFVTNDVALLIIIPITLKANINAKEWVIILESIAANAGSVLTPFGNPQNLFIYYFYHLHPIEFFQTILPLTLTFLFVLIIAASFVKVQNFQPVDHSEKLNSKCYIYLIAFLIFIFAILKLLPIYVGIFIIIYALIWDKKSFKIDYALLISFFCFFGFTDNLKSLITIKFDNSYHMFFTTVFLSQFISNVPATLLLSDFTTNWKALLWGASVGGFGSITGSLASIITYKLYVSSHKHINTGLFLLKFHILNYIALLIGVVLYFASGF